MKFWNLAYQTPWTKRVPSACFTPWIWKTLRFGHVERDKDQKQRLVIRTITSGSLLLDLTIFRSQATQITVYWVVLGKMFLQGLFNPPSLVRWRMRVSSWHGRTAQNFSGWLPRRRTGRGEPDPISWPNQSTSVTISNSQSSRWWDVSHR